MIVFRVAVDQEARILQMGGIQMTRARHPLLLIHRDNRTDRSVRLCILHGGQDLCDADAVITAEACPVCGQKFLRALQFDRIAQRIIDDTRLCNTDHIHMSLQNCARCRLTALCCRQIGNDVQCLVLRHCAADLCETLLQIVTDRPLMA